MNLGANDLHRLYQSLERQAWHLQAEANKAPTPEQAAALMDERAKVRDLLTRLRASEDSGPID